MATRVSTTLHPDCSTDLNFRAWTQFIEDTLVATGGWSVTSDTGQTVPSTMAHPTGNNQAVGYRIYTMSDSLQSTAPVFMKVEYGQSPFAGSIPGTWITIGTGSNGSGTITGVMMARTLVGPVTNFSDPAFITNSYGSAASNRAGWGLFIQTSQSCVMCFSIERSKNALGADTGDGLLLLYTGAVRPALETSRYLSYQIAVQPAIEQGLSYILTSSNPTQTLGGDIGLGVISHFRGIAQQPGTNMVIVNSGDVGGQGSFTATIYGLARTYQQLDSRLPPGQATTNNTGSNEDANRRCCMRFD